MKTIAQMITDVLKREGGYVNHPADRGGPTKYGITQATLAAWRSKAVTASGVRRLTEREARVIYEYEFYVKPGIDRLPTSIQPFVFDAAVNHGPSQAIKFVQQVCTIAGYDPGEIDGIIGPRTIGAANAYANEFVYRLVYRREDFYHDLVRREPRQRVFLAGWLSRLEEFRTDVA